MTRSVWIDHNTTHNLAVYDAHELQRLHALARSYPERLAWRQ